MKNLIYLAGPITGLSFGESTDWRQYVMDNLHEDIIGLSPLRAKDSYLKNEGCLGDKYEEWPLSTQRAVYARDKWDCERADLVLVNLLGAKTVSIGTVMEIAWAAAKNIPVVLVMEDDNIHTHAMLREACPFIVSDLDKAIDILHALLIAYEHK
jgi:nucleoside 2-deoxyribosyltransferase